MWFNKARLDKMVVRVHLFEFNFWCVAQRFGVAAEAWYNRWIDNLSSLISYEELSSLPIYSLRIGEQVLVFILCGVATSCQ